MTSPIIYSDLRFSGAAPRSANHRDSTPEDPTEDGDIMYENVISPPLAREKRPPPATPAPAMGRGQQLMSGFRKCSLHLSLVFLLLCLLLSAAVITMTVKYLQKSSDFQTLMTDHQTMSSGMTRSLRSGEDLLKSLRNDLANTKAELEKTQRELRKLEQDHRDQNNRMTSSLKSTESLLEAANTKLTRTQNDLERIRSELQAERSKKNNLHNDLQTCRDEQKPTSEELNKCRQSIQDFCPEGWELFGKKCLWFSKEEKWWQYSDNDCKRKDSNLLVVEYSDENKIKEFIKKKNGSYLVRRKWHTERYWYINIYGNFNSVDYYTHYKWICERNIVLPRADQTCA